MNNITKNITEIIPEKAVKSFPKKKSKYTSEQKIAAIEALEIAKKLNNMLDKTLQKYESETSSINNKDSPKN